jgi:glycosyltransferase involved in cell wall biosynthesis
MTYKIGISISSRNRCQVLQLCLEKWAEHLPKCDFKFVVIDDASDHPERSNYEEMLNEFPFVEYRRNETRLGIASTKNRCLQELEDCDFIFLADDDVFPISDNWAQHFISAYERTGCHHFAYQNKAPWLGYQQTVNGIDVFQNSSGVFMFFTKKVLEVCGGYDSRMTTYGYEHSLMSLRIYNAGLMNGYHHYVCPEGADEHLFSLDLDMNCLGKRPPHRPDFHQDKYEFVSSIEGEDVQQYINYNAQFFNNFQNVYRDYK